jgi:hypothetical protein
MDRASDPSLNRSIQHGCVSVLAHMTFKHCT